MIITKGNTMKRKTYLQIMSGNSDSNIHFSDVCRLLEGCGFNYRIHGDHYIFTREDIVEIINIQPNGNKAKAYQIKQIRLMFKKYGI